MSSSDLEQREPGAQLPPVAQVPDKQTTDQPQRLGLTAGAFGRRRSVTRGGAAPSSQWFGGGDTPAA